ncbi:hypothetical protein Tco_0057557 [Tanacetum coccineum]
MLVNALRRIRESLRRVSDGTEAFLILTLFILCLDKDITAKIAGKIVSISEASIRTDLIFDDADGIGLLTNLKLSLMLFSVWDMLGINYVNFNNALVFSPMEGKSFLRQKLQLCFDTMLVQPTQDEGASSERLSVEQPSPSPAPTSEVPNESLPDSSSAQPSEISEDGVIAAKTPRKSSSKIIGSTKRVLEEQKELHYLNMSQAKAASKEKKKGVELKDVEEIDRPRPTSTRSLLTLKPLPKIDPKDKGKKKIEEEDESESEDDDIPQAVKKFKQLESDEVLAREIFKKNGKLRGEK